MEPEKIELEMPQENKIPKKKQSNGVIIYLAILVLVVFALGAIAFLVVSGAQENKPIPSDLNYYDAGFKQGYYIGLYNFDIYAKCITDSESDDQKIALCNNEFMKANNSILSDMNKYADFIPKERGSQAAKLS